MHKKTICPWRTLEICVLDCGKINASYRARVARARGFSWITVKFFHTWRPRATARRDNRIYDNSGHNHATRFLSCIWFFSCIKVFFPMRILNQIGSHRLNLAPRLTVYPPRIQIADVAISSSQSCDRKSKFGLRHAINLNQLYCMTKSEFWFSMIPPRTRSSNVRSSVLLNFTV